MQLIRKKAQRWHEESLHFQSRFFVEEIWSDSLLKYVSTLIKSSLGAAVTATFPNNDL